MRKLRLEDMLRLKARNIVKDDCTFLELFLYLTHELEWNPMRWKLARNKKSFFVFKFTTR